MSEKVEVKEVCSLCGDVDITVFEEPAGTYKIIIEMSQDEVGIDNAIVFLTPTQARNLAGALNALADKIGGLCPERISR